MRPMFDDPSDAIVDDGASLTTKIPLFRSISSRVSNADRPTCRRLPASVGLAAPVGTDPDFDGAWAGGEICSRVVFSTIALRLIVLATRKSSSSNRNGFGR